MPTTPRTGAVLSVALVALVAACDAQPPTAAPGGPITVTASDTGCQISATTAPAGNVTFQIANQGSKVTEFYRYGKGDRIMGEVENIQLADAARGYARYVAGQTAAFADETRKFAETVKAKDVSGAKAQYARTRIHYERIEPVAAKFGDLDPAIDVREADLRPGRRFTGFHRLEKDLWVTGLRPDSPAIADQLVTDVTTLGQKAAALQLSVLDLANDAKSLLDEVATGRIIGEEEAFSHTDLSDFQANVDGSKGAVQALRPVLAERNPTLVSDLDNRFADVPKLLDAQRTVVAK
jgi:iron uptake system component EfeO